MPDIFNSPSSQSNSKPIAPTSNVEQQPPSSPQPPPDKPAGLSQPVGIPIKRMSFFSTLALTPDGVTFANQEPDEDVELFFRTDFITNVPWILTTIVLLCIPFLISALLPISGIAFSFFSPQIVFTVLAFFYLLVFGYALINIMYWFYNVGIVSKKHLIDIDFAEVTYKNIATSTMDEVSDINYTQQGFLATLFDYGNVDIRTQGSNVAIEFSRVPQPGKIANIIQQLREQVNNG